MYLVLVTMEKRSNGKKSSHTYEIEALDPLMAKKQAMGSAKEDFGVTHMDFKIKSCQKDR